MGTSYEGRALGGGYYHIEDPDGARHSKHTAEREAFEKATQWLSSNVEMEYVDYVHDYRVRVTRSGATVEAVSEEDLSTDITGFIQAGYNEDGQTVVIIGRTWNLVIEVLKERSLGRWRRQDLWLSKDGKRKRVGAIWRGILVEWRDTDLRLLAS